MKNLPHLKLTDYQRLFRLKGGILYLVSDVFGGHYKNLNCLLTGIDGVWTSYLPKKVVEETLQDGLKLLSSTELFEQYRIDFDEYKKRSAEFFDTVLKKEKLQKEETIKFLILISEMFSFYSKTEFFYTDLAYIELEKNPSAILKQNLEAFEEVKNSGRQYLNQLIFSSGYADQLLDKLTRQFNLPLDDLKMYQVSEVAELFCNKKVSEDILVMRREAFVQYSEDKEMLYFEGKEAGRIAAEFVGESESKLKEVLGTTANKGYAKGKIKVIPPDYYEDFNILPKLFSEMEKGDILVAETTSPELMPACQKAGAIITDQGGLLSHAAIVSRELGIPCIVGTGNATEILKNGDMVEVDANKGLVRIIS